MNKVGHESVDYPSSLVSVPSRSVNCSVCSSHYKTMVLINYHRTKSIFEPLETFSATKKTATKKLKKSLKQHIRTGSDIDASLSRKRRSVWDNDYRFNTPSDIIYYREPKGILERLRSIDFGEKRLLAVKYDSFIRSNMYEISGLLVPLES